MAALHSAQAALSVARAQQRRARERRRGDALRWWDEGGPVGPRSPAELEEFEAWLRTAFGGGEEVGASLPDLEVDYDPHGLEQEWVYDPWSRTWGPPDELGWW